MGNGATATVGAEKGSGKGKGRNESMQLFSASAIGSGVAQQIGDYRDLVAWQRAMDLAVLVDEICERLPRKAWKLAAQMQSAANSIHANIAEGNGRFSTADYLRHLSMANASLNELESDLHFVTRRYPNIEQATKGQELAVAVRKPLWGLIKSLRRKRRDERS
jgi:four helix bundle protein